MFLALNTPLVGTQICAQLFRFSVSPEDAHDAELLYNRASCGIGFLFGEGPWQVTTYDHFFYPIFGAGCAIAATVSFLAAFFAARKTGFVWRCILPVTALGVGIIAFWAGLFIGSEVGYQAWQSAPNPPDEAFSDTFPLGALLFGWLPGGLFCGAVFGIVFGVTWLVRHNPPASAPGFSSGVSDSGSVETGNPYQAPNPRKGRSMRRIPVVLLATLSTIGLSQFGFSQQPIAKGSWSYKDGKPQSVTFDYGTKLTAEDIERISAVESIARISMGHAGVDSEYVTIEGDLFTLRRLNNLENVHLNKDGIVDDDLKFIAELPGIRELAFNAANGEGGCTDRCADYLSAAKTLRELRIHNGHFTDTFIDKITKGRPPLEQLMLSSPKLTDESLRLLAERCKNLKSLSISSDHFTAAGLKHLDKLPNLKHRGVRSPYFQWQAVAESWLRQAESACDKIQDDDVADYAFARLQAIYIERGEIENAERIAQRIKEPFQRVKAHIANARHYAEAGNVEQCKITLNLAKPLAVTSRLSGSALVEAYLQLAESPALAVSFRGADDDDAYTRERLCQALARHGYLDEAWKIADRDVDDKRQNALRLTIALAAARAGRIEDTEKASQKLSVRNLAQQKIWGELAVALYKKQDLQSARLYAARVTSSHSKRTNEYLRRIEGNMPPDTPSISTYAHPPNETRTPLTIPLPSEDPDAANRTLEAVIAEAERNPVESTRGQFGPWNQRFQLARIRVQYSLVAALYRKAGNQEQARAKMQLAEDALQLLTEEERGFGAIFALNELQGPLISFKDTEALRRLAEGSHTPLLYWAADAVVPDMLLSGDIEAARELAKTTLSRVHDFDWSRGVRSEIVSCFIEAGHVDAAHDLVRICKPGAFTAAACENAGRAMVETKNWQLLETPKWRNGIGAFQRAHLCMGAALTAHQ